VIEKFGSARLASGYTISFQGKPGFETGDVTGFFSGEGLDLWTEVSTLTSKLTGRGLGLVSADGVWSLSITPTTLGAPNLAASSYDPSFYDGGDFTLSVPLVDGVPVGREIGRDVVPAHRSGKSAVPPQTTEGSIIVVLATDAPLIPLQCQRLARRATTGLSWVGGIGANGSGDIFIAFSTGNHIGQNDKISNVNMLAPDAMTSLFQASAEATEEAILNAMCMAETMSGRDCRTIHALPLDLLQEVMRRYRPEQRA